LLKYSTLDSSVEIVDLAKMPSPIKKEETQEEPQNDERTRRADGIRSVRAATAQVRNCECCRRRIIGSRVVDAIAREHHRIRAVTSGERVIAGPSGAPSSVQVPLRVAVVQGGVSEKTIATKAYQTTVNMTESGSEPFTLVAEDLVYPAPSGAVGDTYIFYIGFDPQALKPEKPAPRAPKKKQ